MFKNRSWDDLDIMRWFLVAAAVVIMAIIVYRHKHPLIETVESAEFHVISKQHENSHTTMVMFRMGPVISVRPKEWNLKLASKAETVTNHFSQSFFDSVSVGDVLTCTFVRGRISNEPIIRACAK